MRIMVTGASGNYGREAVERLLDLVPAGDLVLISRSPAKLAHFAERGCEVRAGDFDDPELMTRALAGCDRMLMISTGRVGARVAQHGLAIDAAKAAGVRHIVYTSFIGIDQPGNPALVAVDHGGTEALLRQSGIAWTFLRDSQYADAMTEAAGPMALAAGLWRSSTADGKISFVTRSDCVACAGAVLSSDGHENRIYTITGPEALSFRDVSQIFADIAGTPIAYENVTDEDMYAQWDAMGVPRSAIDDHVVSGFAWSSEDMVSFEAAIRGGYLSAVTDDVERLTGRKPESFRNFAERTFVGALAKTTD